MSKISVDEITDEAGTGAPDFPNGATVSGNLSVDGGTIKLDGNVGIGVVPSTKLHVKNGINQNFNVFGPSVFSNGVTIASTTDGFTGYVEMEHRASQFAWHNGTTERMRVTSAGDLLVGTTDTNVAFTNTVGIALKDGHAQMSQDGNGALYLNRKGTDGATQYFHKDGTAVGSVSVTASATAYNTSSDYRLKTDAQPMTGASARVQALNPVNFEWLSDGTRVDGFLAHEAQAVVPEAVHGTKDAMKDEEYEVTPAVLDEDGNETTAAVMGTRSVPNYQGIDQSKLVPLLTAALQEALTKIDDMETRLAALENN